MPQIWFVDRPNKKEYNTLRKLMTEPSTILLKHLSSFELNYLHTKILPLIIALKQVPHFDLKVAALSMGLPTFIYATSLH